MDDVLFHPRSNGWGYRYCLVRLSEVHDPDPVGEVEIGIVGDRNRLPAAVEGDDAGDRPEISSRAIVMSLVTSVKIVGATKAPFTSPADTSPPSTHSAPACLPMPI